MGGLLVSKPNCKYVTLLKKMKSSYLQEMKVGSVCPKTGFSSEISYEMQRGCIRILQRKKQLKEFACYAGDAWDTGLIPRSGRSPAEGHGNALQYSCLENPMDRGVWWATVHGPNLTPYYLLSTPTSFFQTHLSTNFQISRKPPVSSSSSWL